MSENSDKIPQPGESAGNTPLSIGKNRVFIDREEKLIECELLGFEMLSLEEILTSSKLDKASIPYYEDVYQDILRGDESWDVTKKVEEYADYLRRYPNSIATLPPIQCLNGRLYDGAHRISAIYLLSKMYPDSHWRTMKIKVEFYESDDRGLRAHEKEKLFNR